MPVKTEQKTTIRTGPKGERITETEGRDLDPSGSLAVDEKMKKTDLGAIARGAAAKKKADEDKGRKAAVGDLLSKKKVGY